MSWPNVNLFLILSIKQAETEQITAKGEITFDESIYDGKNIIKTQQVGEG